MSPIILFDVNETLLDLSSLKPHFGRLFGDESAVSQWFVQLLRSSMVATLTADYHDFGVLGRDALAMVALRHNIALTAADQDAILEGMAHLTPHPEVPAALERLKTAGFRLATLTNSPPYLLQDQLTNAGLMHLFEQTLSVDATRKFKPAPEPYQYAAVQLGALPHEICMVAAHDWDIAGAMHVGMMGAFIARPNMVLGPLQRQPDIVGSDMTAVVDQILALKTKNL